MKADKAMASTRTLERPHGSACEQSVGTAPVDPLLGGLQGMAVGIGPGWERVPQQAGRVGAARVDRALDEHEGPPACRRAVREQAEAPAAIRHDARHVMRVVGARLFAGHGAGHERQARADRAGPFSPIELWLRLHRGEDTANPVEADLGCERQAGITDGPSSAVRVRRVS
jgi:hypothetical protein